MKSTKRKKLERAGWRVGSTQDFLGIDDAEMALIDMRVSLASELHRRRVERNMSQRDLATEIGSSQSRVAKMEAGDPSVSIDLLLRSLITTGSTRHDIGRTIAQSQRRKGKTVSARHKQSR